MDQFLDSNTHQNNPNMALPEPRIAFVQARWHSAIVDQSRVGFEAELKRLGVTPEIFDVYDAPGAFDIPLLAKKLAESERYEAIVAAGLVVDGGIYRHDFVASTVVQALMNAQLETGVPMLSVVLTPHHFQEHQAHIDFFSRHFVLKGEEAARACVQIIRTMRELPKMTSLAA